MVGWRETPSQLYIYMKIPRPKLDVLEVILGKLEIPDLVRAGFVCCSWCNAYTSLRDLGRYKQSQTPCLFYTSKSTGDNVACLYSLVEKRVYKLTLPEPPIRSWILIGSSNGWLITADEGSELLLVDPFTSEQIALPLVVTIEHVKPIFDDSGTIHKFELSYYTGEKVYAAPEIYILAMISVKSSTTRHLCSLIVLLEAVLWCLSTIHIFSFCLCDQGMISGLGCHPMQDTEIACTGVVYCMH